MVGSWAVQRCKPEWKKLQDIADPKLSEAEQAFLDLI